MMRETRRKMGEKGTKKCPPSLAKRKQRRPSYVQYR